MILRQPFIKVERSATRQEIKEETEKRGFLFNAINDIRDIEKGVIIRDSHTENVLINDVGNVIFIDPLIQFTENSLLIQDIWDDFAQV